MPARCIRGFSGMDASPLFLTSGLVIYIIASRLVMRLLRGGSREMSMALLNLAGVYFFFYNHDNDRVHHYYGLRLFAGCLLLVLLQYAAFCLFADAKGRLIWLAFFCPIASLIAIRYFPSSAWTLVQTLTRRLV